MFPAAFGAFSRFRLCLPCPCAAMKRPAEPSPEETEKERAAKARREHGKSQLEKRRVDLKATARRWGNASWVWNDGPGSLWQVQVKHDAVEYSMEQGAFRKSLIKTAREALKYHPNPKVFDLNTLRREEKVIVLNGAPPSGPGQSDSRADQSDSRVDPDSMGFVTWRPVLYAAGGSPIAALTVIRLIMEEKVRAKQFPKLPSFTLVYAMGPHEEPPLCKLNPDVWTVTTAGWWHHSLYHNPFSFLPPLGRRHVLGYLQVASKSGDDGSVLYDLFLYGGIYYFRDGFDRLKVPMFSKRPLPATGKTDTFRALYGLKDGEGVRVYIQKVLHEALLGVPVKFTNVVENAEDAFALWLSGQPSIMLQPPEEELHAEEFPAAAAGQPASQLSAPDP